LAGGTEPAELETLFGRLQMAGLRQAFDRIAERRQVLAPERELGPESRMRLVKLHGDFSLAHAAATEPYLSTFGDERGFIAYGRKSGHVFALGNPVASREDAPALLAEFVERFGTPVFVAVNGASAATLSALGQRINAFGDDTLIDLRGHSFAGKDGKSIRYTTSWVAANGYTIAERPIEDFAPELIASMARKWRESRVASRREIQFLNRRFDPVSEPGVRRFFALDAEGRRQAFISFDPLWRDGSVIGYLASNKRRDPGGSSYLDLAIMRHAIDVFRDEGLETCSLGLSPLARLDPPPFPDDRVTRFMLRRAARSGWVNRRIFNFEGLAAYKARFRGRRVPHFLALPPDGRNALRLVSMLRLMRLI
jgi:lysylphosphatidylglycerol synthetase-like protein (DUF2156 family)